MLEDASLIVDAIFYPIIYKYGCEKSSFVLMSIVMVLIGVFALLSIYIKSQELLCVNRQFENHRFSQK